MYVESMAPVAYFYPWGLGDVTPGEISGAGSAAANIAQLATSNAPVSTQIEGSIGAGLLAAAPFSGPAAPFLAVAGVVAELLAKFGVGSGCGSTCVLSSEYANQAEAALQQNINTYFALPAPRTQSQQQAAETIYASIWSDLVQQCGSSPLAGTDAGKRCISDRAQGSCAYKQTGTPSYPGAPAMGACWNWYLAYFAPIAADPVIPDTTTSAVTSALTSLTGSSGGTLLLLGAAALVALAVFS